LLHDLLHLGFDAGEVVGGDGRVQGDVVVEAVFQRRAVGELGVGPEALDGFGHDVRGRVAQHEEGLGIAVGEDGDLVVAGEARGEVDDLAVDFCGDGGLGQALADRAREVEHGGAVGDLFDAAVGEGDAGHGYWLLVASC
jgi:hypothetical protein